MKALSPIILLGMHRSGTTMLTRHLETLGLFVGQKKEENNEALFFQKLNSWLLKECCASWDNPCYFTTCLDSNPFVKKELIRVAIRHLSSIRSIEYLGISRYHKHGDIRRLTIPWGWKDPRNTFTVELWKEIFPAAKIIHIYRNPIDIAESLRKREWRLRKKFKATLKSKIKQMLLRGKTNLVGSMRVGDILGGVELWKEYLLQASKMEEKFSEDWLTIQYEEYLERPGYYLEIISKHIGLDFDNDKLGYIANTTDVSRKYAFLNKEELVAIYKEVQGDEVIAQWGYGNLLSS